MPPYITPGVYVEENSPFQPSVEEVPTAVPAFIGYTKTARNKEENDLRLVPTRILSMMEYEKYFGTTDNVSFTINLVEESSKNEISILQPMAVPALTYNMYYSMKMFFANGGGPCYIVSVGSMHNEISKGNDAAGLLGGLKVLEREDEPALILLPDATSLGSEKDFFEVMNAALKQCSRLKDRFTISDIYNQDTDGFRNAISSDRDDVKFGAAYHPWLETSLNFAFDDSSVTIGTHDNASTDLSGKQLGATEIKEQNTALYNTIKEELLKVRVTLPPGPAIAGVYARVDASRGVWKAPANEGLFNVIKPTIEITSIEQEDLNVDATAGKSINAIRAFTGKGTLVWGARTLAGNDNEWRYVPVRRFFNMVEESVRKSTCWAVFEPNDANTWIKVKSLIENYLTRKWRDGALAGSKPEHAFYVAVGLGTTMTDQDILDGRMIVEIGMAVVKPAEFVILRFSHKMQEA